MGEAQAEMSAGIQFFSAGLPEDTGAILADGILGDSTARAAALARLRSILDAAQRSCRASYRGHSSHWASLKRVCASSQTFPPRRTSGMLHWSARGQAARSSSAFPQFARKAGIAELWDP